MMNKIKSFYNKDHTDLSKGYVDPSVFHQTLYQVMVAFKVADLNNQEPPSYFNQNAILFVDGLIATVLTAISVYRGLKPFDLTNITEAGTYTIPLIYELLMLYCTRKNIPQYHNFLRAPKQDFHYICTKGHKYRAQYFEEQLKTWKICIITCVFTAAAAIAMNMFAYVSLFYFLATHDANTKGSRPLLFPISLPNVDISKSPVYEVAFMFANITVVLYCYNYTFMLQTQIVWIRQIVSKVDIVICSVIHPPWMAHPVGTSVKLIIKKALEELGI